MARQPRTAALGYPVKGADAAKAAKDHFWTEGRTVARTRNTLLAAVIKETDWSQAQLAARFVRVAAENRAEELRSVTRSHISMWIGGTRPEGRAPHILCETLSRRLGRRITPAQLGLATPEQAATTAPGWDVDTVTALVDLGDAAVGSARVPRFLNVGKPKPAYQLMAAAVPRAGL